MNDTEKKIIGITLGDPGGIGPEVVQKALNAYGENRPFVPKFYGEMSSDCIGKPNAQNGLTAYRAIQHATDDALSGKIHALITAPVCKESFSLAKIPFTGHTTLLQKLTGIESVSMGFYTPKLKVVLATIHVPLRDVPDLITEPLLEKTILRGIEFCKSCGIQNPKIAVAGLNPHASENGLFGHEEKQIIEPTVLKWKEEGCAIEGPLSADTVYYRAYKGEFDLVVSLYHDQGLIPIKLIGFHDAVNVTLGLPFIRTSPDHGTAFDIVGQNKANPDSMIASIKLALKFLNSNAP